MPILVLAAKDFRLLQRDPRAALLLFLMPVILIVVLSLALGESFGQKPDNKLRVSVVILDRGLPPEATDFPKKPWSEVVLDDLATTADLKVEKISTIEEAEELVRRGERAAVLIFSEDFSRRMHRCSFLSQKLPSDGQLVEPLNPFYEDGIAVEELGVRLLPDKRQPVAVSIIEQVAQVTLLRVVMPWMIGRAFDRVGDDRFMKDMAKTVKTPVPIPEFAIRGMGPAVKDSIKNLFDRYNLQAKTWAELTKKRPRDPRSDNVSTYGGPDGVGFLRRGGMRYQVLVPTYIVMFAFFMILTVGWMFVTERRQGTLVRLRAAPLSRSQILLGKFLPCYVVSFVQGCFLLIAGKLIFGMKWGPEPLLLLAVVASTSLAAMGLALLVASVARTETQVAIFGTLLVLVLGGISGSLMPRDLLPEQLKEISLFTPHAWALEAYSQLLTLDTPDLALVGKCCGVLIGFGVGFLAAAWRFMRLD